MSRKRMPVPAFDRPLEKLAEGFAVQYESDGTLMFNDDAFQVFEKRKHAEEAIPFGEGVVVRVAIVKL